MSAAVMPIRAWAIRFRDEEQRRADGGLGRGRRLTGITAAGVAESLDGRRLPVEEIGRGAVLDGAALAVGDGWTFKEKDLTKRPITTCSNLREEDAHPTARRVLGSRIPNKARDVARNGEKKGWQRTDLSTEPLEHKATQRSAASGAATRALPGGQGGAISSRIVDDVTRV